MPKISLPQKNITLEVALHVNLMEVLRKNNIPVASSCLGEGICGKCRMIIQGALALPLELEMQTLNRNKISMDERLACQITVTSNLALSTTYW